MTTQAAVRAPEPDVTPWTYRVSPFPPDTMAGSYFSAWVRQDGHGRWVVTPHYQMSPVEYIAPDGNETWDIHRFDDFDAAVRAASAAVMKRRVGGMTVDDAAAKLAQKADMS